MAPLHHHFELLGWTETQVVVRFLDHRGGICPGRAGDVEVEVDGGVRDPSRVLVIGLGRSGRGRGAAGRRDGAEVWVTDLSGRNGNLRRPLDSASPEGRRPFLGGPPGGLPRRTSVWSSCRRACRPDCRLLRVGRQPWHCRRDRVRVCLASPAGMRRWWRSPVPTARARSPNWWPICCARTAIGRCGGRQSRHPGVRNGPRRRMEELGAGGVELPGGAARRRWTRKCGVSSTSARITSSATRTWRRISTAKTQAVRLPGCEATWRCSTPMIPRWRRRRPRAGQAVVLAERDGDAGARRRRCCWCTARSSSRPPR